MSVVTAESNKCFSTTAGLSGPSESRFLLLEVFCGLPWSGRCDGVVKGEAKVGVGRGAGDEVVGEGEAQGRGEAAERRKESPVEGVSYRWGAGELACVGVCMCVLQCVSVCLCVCVCI